MDQTQQPDRALDSVEAALEAVKEAIHDGLRVLRRQQPPRPKAGDDA